MIEQVTARENYLIQRSKKETNIIKPQERTVSDEISLYEENRAIYEKYVYIVLEDGEQQLEALKRAVFFQWFAHSEPSYLSFISGLQPELQLSIFEKLQQLVQNNKLDLEFENMLAWYYFITDWYFDNFVNLSILLAYLKQISMTCQPLEYFNRPSKFYNRGQMGIYWQSLLNN